MYSVICAIFIFCFGLCAEPTRWIRTGNRALQAGGSFNVLQRHLSDSVRQLVYDRHLARANTAIDEKACAEVMLCHRLGTKHEVINSALRAAACGPLDINKARQIARRSHDLILLDTSTWIEFLRGTGSAACKRVEAALGSDIAVCGAVRVEALAGARD